MNTQFSYINCEKILASISPFMMKSFCKNYAIPIPVIQMPYLAYYFDLLNPMFHTYEKFTPAFKMLNDFDNNSEQVSQNIHTVVDALIKHIEESETYKFLTLMDLKEFQNAFSFFGNKMHLENIYIVRNVGKYILSIDLREANFQSFYYAMHSGLLPECPSDLYNGKNTYDTFARDFTQYQYIIGSKRRRQVIFGNINTKRQQHIQQHMINLIYDYIRKEYPDIIFNKMSHDEIFCVIDNLNDAKEIYQKISEMLKVVLIQHKISTTIELFQIQHLFVDNGFLKIDVHTGKKKLKGIPIDKFIQFYKYYYLNQQIKDDDLYFMNGADLCKYVQPVIKQGG